MTDKPLNIAHRGGADLWPENTLEAFSRAIYMGVDGIEFDLQLSADGHLMVHHDARLKPEATRLEGDFLKKPTPRLDTLSLAQLQSYDVGRLQPDSPYHQRRPERAHMDGAHIPSLAEFDALLAAQTDKHFRAYAELKTDMRGTAQSKAQAEKLAEAYIHALSGSPVGDRHIVISFDWRCLNIVRQAFPDIRHAYTTLEFSLTDPAHESAAADKPDGYAALIRQASKNGAPWWGDTDWRDMQGDSHAERVLRAIQAAGGRGWFAYWRDITPETMAMATSLGLEVSAWTVNEAADMKRLAALGVSALITDRPDILKKL